MTDSALRRLEAEWLRSPADDALADQLVTACRRARRDPPWSALRRCERWRRVDGFVTKWFTRPLEETDGVPPEELDAAAQARGWHEPLSLREWFQLAGRRRDLTASWDWHDGLVHEALPADRHAGVTLFETGGTAWSIRGEHMEEPEPRVEWQGDREAYQQPRLLGQRLPEFVEALVLWTFLNALVIHVDDRTFHGTRRPHGAVRGGLGGDLRGLESYHRLPVVFHEVEPRPFHGDADTLIYLGPDGLTGAARTRPAFDRLEAAFPRLASVLWG